jgi:hypothetical protein
VDLVAKPMDVETWPARLVNGLTLVGGWELFAAVSCSRMLVG